MKVRIRKLKNEKWVAETKGLFCWRAIDAQTPGYAWLPGSSYYHHCWVDSEQDAEKLVRDYVSLYGI